MVHAHLHSSPLPCVLELLVLSSCPYHLEVHLPEIVPRTLGFLGCCGVCAVPVGQGVAAAVLQSQRRTGRWWKGKGVVAGMEMVLREASLGNTLCRCPRLPLHSALCVACKVRFRGQLYGLWRVSTDKEDLGIICPVALGKGVVADVVCLEHRSQVNAAGWGRYGCAVGSRCCRPLLVVRMLPA